MIGAAPPNRFGGVMAGTISMGARREVLSAVAERYRSAGRTEKGRILDELCATTGWHRKHAVRALRRHETPRRTSRGPRERTAQVRRDDQGRADGIVGSVGSGVRQAARGDDPDLAASTRATRPIEAWQGETVICSRGERRNDRSDARRREDRGERAAGGGAPASTRRSVARCRSGRSTTGRTRRQASARSTWWRMAARRWRARSSRL